eukprot:569352-Lingulodinium_polyedra.AAC.1
MRCEVKACSCFPSSGVGARARLHAIVILPNLFFHCTCVLFNGLSKHDKGAPGRSGHYLSKGVYGHLPDVFPKFR